MVLRCGGMRSAFPPYACSRWVHHCTPTNVTQGARERTTMKAKKLGKSWAHLIGKVLTLTCFSVTSAPGQTTSSHLTSTRELHFAIGFSFYMDLCGDTRYGSIFRRAMLDEADQCPFSSATKKELHSFAAIATKNYKTAIGQYYEKYRKSPDLGGDLQCDKRHKNPIYLKLDRYARGEISASVAVPDFCHWPDAGP